MDNCGMKVELEFDDRDGANFEEFAAAQRMTVRDFLKWVVLMQFRPWAEKPGQADAVQSDQ
jgi:hypothetical protein